VVDDLAGAEGRARRTAAMYRHCRPLGAIVSFRSRRPLDRVMDPLMGHELMEHRETRPGGAADQQVSPAELRHAEY
jgi:hypothetical protein